MILFPLRFHKVQERPAIDCELLVVGFLPNFNLLGNLLLHLVREQSFYNHTPTHSNTELQVNDWIIRTFWNILKWNRPLGALSLSSCALFLLSINCTLCWRICLDHWPFSVKQQTFNLLWKTSLRGHLEDKCCDQPDATNKRSLVSSPRIPRTDQTVSVCVKHSPACLCSPQSTAWQSWLHDREPPTNLLCSRLE